MLNITGPQSHTALHIPSYGERCKKKPPAYEVSKALEHGSSSAHRSWGVQSISISSIFRRFPTLNLGTTREKQTHTIEHTNFICTNQTSTSMSLKQHIVVHAHTGYYSAVTKNEQLKPQHTEILDESHNLYVE